MHRDSGTRLHWLAAVCCLFFAGCPGLTLRAAPPPSFQMRSIAIPPELKSTSTENLIDRLQQEGERKYQPLGWTPGSYAIRRPALPKHFAVLAARPSWDLRLEPPPDDEISASTSPVVAELVRRGVDALPALLAHLSDARPTQLRLRLPHNAMLHLTDYFDPRWPEPSQQSKEVNRATPVPITDRDGYIVRVGDICFHTIGQIVNRRLDLDGRHPPTAGQSHRDTAINSPLESPALAEAARRDWAGVTEAEHRQSLREDAARTAPAEFGYVLNAVQRLLFYYPEIGWEIAESMLERPVVSHLRDGNRVADEISDHELRLLVNALTPFHWTGLPERHYALFDRLRGQTSDAEAPHDRDELLLLCAQRAAGNGHDADLRRYYVSRLAALDRAAAEETRPGFRRHAKEHAQRIRAFLGSLAQNTRAS